MTNSIQDLLNELTEAARTNRDKGTLFERLIANYLVTDPQYSDRLSDVWLWAEWPERWSSDVGIDLVARERATGDYWAIQCKFYDPLYAIQKGDIDSFFTASGKRFATKSGACYFANRMLVSTTDKWSKHAEEALTDQTVPVTRLWFKDLAESPIDWSQFSLSKVHDIRLKPKKNLREHQAEAVGHVLKGLENHDRGKLIMACGTGKTFTSLRLAEQIASPGGRVLFLAPSISLVAQSLREWTSEAETPIHAFVVCSDTKVGKDEEDIRIHDLAYPATTDARKLTAASHAVTADRRTVVFSTYQSIQVLADAQQLGLGEFDLIICDEAHRTTGLTLPGEDPSDFVKVHHDHIVRARKRLYMTATPRIYAEVSKTKANQSAAVLFSMDDAATYGSELYRLGFGKAVERDLLTEYKVLIVAVKETEMAKLANNFNNAFKIDEKKAIDIRFAAKIVGTWKGLSKRGLVMVGEDGQEEAVAEGGAPMHRAVAFSKSIKDSKQTTEVFGQLIELYRESRYGDADAFAGMVECTLDHVDGTMNALKRQSGLDWLKADIAEGNCRILSNARCLSEGIDVPALDAVVFFDTRESIVDIVQSVGRVMRKAEGKQFGYIILPVCIPSERVQDYNAYIDSDPQFKGIWKVIKALRAHDESLVDEAEFRRKIKVIADPDRNGRGDRQGEQGALPVDFPMLPIDAVNEAVYAAIPKKLGDREYWSEWAKSIGQVALRLIARIDALVASSPQLATDLDRFLKGLQDTLNPAVSRDDAVEMLAQHILTLPVFQALFADTSFPQSNVVGKALQGIVKRLDAAAVASETEGLDKFYDNVRERIAHAKSDKSKQNVIRNLYDTFFHNAFPRLAERLGIVYTPVQVVDFILHSVNAALLKHFGESLASPGVQILDPFAGTGTFPVRLIQSGLLGGGHTLRQKFAQEMHANEIVLLAYYIATINIETAYHAVTGEYRPFEGMVLTDTFQMSEEGDMVDKVVLPENNAKVERQLSQPIRVIVGNPPYSGRQENQNDNSKNLKYETLDNRIRSTYAAASNSPNPRNLYDSYIRAVRWATDRICERGVVAFVTNGSFLEKNSLDGLRKCLTEDFSNLYVFNLRGFIRGKSSEDARLEGEGVFEILTGTVISIMVKNPSRTAGCELRYFDIGDSLSRVEKLSAIESLKDISGVNWQLLQQNLEGDWVDQRNPDFEKFCALGNKKDNGAEAVFSFYTQGVLTARDVWTYNMNSKELNSNMARMIDAYNNNRLKYAAVAQAKSNGDIPEVEDIVDADERSISWSRALKVALKRGRVVAPSSQALSIASRRPFSKEWLYFDRVLNEYVNKVPHMFPTAHHGNVYICASGTGARKSFSALVSSALPDFQLIDNGQCFPLYWYEKCEGTTEWQSKWLGFGGKPDADGYVRRDAITDWALGAFCQHYSDQSISKEDIFWYVYGILHSTEYKQRFAADLKKMLPRIPFAKDFHAFCDAGHKLGEWHLNYETIEPYPLREESKRLIMEAEDYRVRKMNFGKKDGRPDKSVVVYNEYLTLRGIPLEAYDYTVNGKSAIEWTMERYQLVTDRASGIENDPNAWSEDPRYIVNLLKRVVRVSVESARVVNNLPVLSENTDNVTYSLT